ncbi:hypothetical protein WJX82_009254 [Trebouxia sp. C0006]
MTIPDIVREGTDFVRRLKSENAWVVVLEKMRNGLGCGLRTAHCIWGIFAVQVVGLQAAAAAEARHPELELLSKKYALYTRDQQVASCH